MISDEVEHQVLKYVRSTRDLGKLWQETKDRLKFTFFTQENYLVQIKLVKPTEEVIKPQKCYDVSELKQTVARLTAYRVIKKQISLV